MGSLFVKNKNLEDSNMKPAFKKKDKIELKSRESPMSREWNKKKLKEKKDLKNTDSSKNVSELNVKLNSKLPLKRETTESSKKDKLKKSEELRLKNRSSKTKLREKLSSKSID